ncbi:MAG: hypothetical protein ACI9KE_003985 [Polyangiales bacterium]|jgi:hypothetical protein
MEIRIYARPADAETSRWFRLQSMAMDSEAPSAERVEGRVTSLDLHRCIERLVNDQPRNEDGEVRFAATYVATGRVDGGQYFLGPATAVQDVVGADALAERGRSCFPEQSAAENSEATTLTYRFSTERQ